MTNRFALAAIAAIFALTGCAKNSATNKTVPDFSTGATLVTVTAVPMSASDGSTIYVTVDGNDAVALIGGESVGLRIPAGKHQIGGYARSLVGHVTIPPVQITTTPDKEKHVVYTVVNSKPAFVERDDGAKKTQPKATPSAASTPAVPAITAAATTTTPAATTTPATTTTPAATTTTAATTTPTTTTTPAATTTTAATTTPTTTTTPAATTTTAATTTPATTSTSAATTPSTTSSTTTPSATATPSTTDTSSSTPATQD